MSMKLIPASSAAWMMRAHSSWSRLPSAPSIIVPRQYMLTRIPRSQRPVAQCHGRDGRSSSRLSVRRMGPVTHTPERLSIGQVAGRTGLSVHTLRFYKKQGNFLSPPLRDSSGARVHQDDVDWLTLCTILRGADALSPQRQSCRIS